MGSVDEGRAACQTPQPLGQEREAPASRAGREARAPLPNLREGVLPSPNPSPASTRERGKKGARIQRSLSHVEWERARVRGQERVPLPG